MAFLMEKRPFLGGASDDDGVAAAARAMEYVDDDMLGSICTRDSEIENRKYIINQETQFTGKVLSPLVI